MAVAIDANEQQLGGVQVRSGPSQLEQLLGWSAEFDERVWAVESAGGLGYLLTQQLVGAGETVLDVPATLASRVRVLATSKSQKTDRHDALSIAIAALRARDLQAVRRADHAMVLRLLAKRHRDLGRARNRSACRLHALLLELVPGGISKEITVRAAQELLDGIAPAEPVAQICHELASEHLDDLRHLDTQMQASRRRLEAAVRAASTTVTDIFGVGPVVAAMVIGHARTIDRFANRDHFAAYAGTAPIELESGGRSIRRLSLRGEPPVEPCNPHRDRHADPSPALARPRLLRPQTRCRQDEEGSVTGAETSDHRRDLPPAPRRRRTHESGPGRASGDDSSIQRDRLRTPNTGASEQPLPDPTQR
jgi:transposase